MIEAAVVIDVLDKPIYWHLPPGRGAAAIPDSSVLWKVLWENRNHLKGVAHSHPGRGCPSPSGTDLTTFAAVESALGRRLDWWIASEDQIVLLRDSRGPSELTPNYWSMTVDPEPEWVNTLRTLSQYKE